MVELEQKIKQIIEKNLPDEEHFLVELGMVAKGDQYLLTILLDADQGVTIDACARLSRVVSNEIDALDLIPSAYRIEVSSPGVDYPLSTERHYHKNIGRKLKVLLKDGTQLEGKLTAVNDQGISLTIKKKEKGKKAVDEVLALDFENVKKSVVQVSFN